MNDLRSTTCPLCHKAHSALEDCRDYVLAPDPRQPRMSDDCPVTDAEKHAYCMKRWGYCATYISPSLYDAADALGRDMRGFVKNQPLPRARVTASGRIKP